MANTKQEIEIKGLVEKYKKYLKSIWKSSEATIKESYYFYLQDINSNKLRDVNYYPSSLEEILSDEDYLKDCLDYYIENEPEFIEENLEA